MRGQLPTLGEAAAATARVFARFPLVMLAGIVTALAGMLQISERGPGELQLRLMAAASLGLPAFTAAALFCERRRADLISRTAINLAAALALAAFYLGWPGWSEVLRFDRYAQLSLAFHLAVAFAPFLGTGSDEEFWHFNIAMFRRFLVAAAFSATLFLGLALALAAMDPLFGLEVEGEAYGRLWMTMAFIFNTAFFLGGVPHASDPPAEPTGYPADLRVLAQYALVPLVTVYLVILTLYTGKVLITWDWPSGWTGWLVSGVGAAGTLSLLLVYPIAGDPRQKWIPIFARTFWIAILPFIVMLWLALYQRVEQYGLTEHRYFVFVLSLWLAVLALYYTVTRSRNIRVIPMSLCIVVLVSFAGPWSAYSVSLWHQRSRLERALERAGMLASLRTATRAPGTVDQAERRTIHGALTYLMTTHGTTAVTPPLDSAMVAERHLPLHPRERESSLAADALLRALGVPGAASAAPRYASAPARPFPAAGLEWVVPLAMRNPDSWPGDSLPYARVVADSLLVELWRGTSPIGRVKLDTLVSRLDSMPEHAGWQRFGEPALSASGPGIELRLTSIGWERTDGRLRLTNLTGLALIQRAAAGRR